MDLHLMLASQTASNSASNGGAVWSGGSVVNVSITNCTFQSNNATYGGGGVLLFETQGDVSITYCTFQDNSATAGGAVKLHTFGNVSITYCTYQNNSATSGGALMLEAFNTVMYVGPQGVLDIFGRSHVNITNCTFIKTQQTMEQHSMS